MKKTIIIKMDLNITIVSFFISIFCFNIFKPKKLIIKELFCHEKKAYVNKFLNINDIMTKMRQIDILMHILLNIEQIKCIKHCIDNDKLNNFIMASDNQINTRVNIIDYLKKQILIKN